MKSHIHLIINFLLSFNFVFSLLPTETLAQKNGINLSFSNIKVEEKNYWFEENLLNLDVEYNRNINSFFGIGSYAGFGIYEEWNCEKDNSTVTSTFLKYSNSSHYGINSKIHLLPFVLKYGIPRFDVYITGKLGLITFNSSTGDTIIPVRGSFFDYSLMGGGSVYLNKKIGLFVEVGYKNYKYYQGLNARYGIAIRF